MIFIQHGIFHFIQHSVNYLIDPRRFFFIFDQLFQLQKDISLQYNEDKTKISKPTSLIVDILFEGNNYFPSHADKIEEICANYLFLPELLKYEQIRECAVRALSSLIDLKFNVNLRGDSDEIKRILNKYVSNNTDIFKIQCLNSVFCTQTLSSIAAFGYTCDNLPSIIQLIIGKDEEIEKLVREMLVFIGGANWISCISPIIMREKNLTFNEIVKEKVKELFNQLKLIGPWQVQSIQLLLTENFMTIFYYYLNDEQIENLIKDRVNPGLEHIHSEVQDSAAELFISTLKNCVTISNHINDYVEQFKFKLNSKEHIQRIAGAKGLTAIITSALIFNDVPQYVLDSFDALANAYLDDSSVKTVIYQFFQDFESVNNENNLLKSTAERLAPYRGLAKPSYIC